MVKKAAQMNKKQYILNGHNFILKKDEVKDIEVMQKRLHLWPEAQVDGVPAAAARCMVERRPSNDRPVHENLMCLNIARGRDDLNDESDMRFVDHRLPLKPGDGPPLPFYMAKEKCMAVGDES